MTETEKVGRLRAQLQVLLDAVDYTAGACKVTEMVGAVLDKRIIDNAKDLLRQTQDPIV